MINDITEIFNDIEYFIKFYDDKRWVETLIDNGELFMQPASHYWNIENNNQSDPNDTRLLGCKGVGSILPIYCLYTVKKEDIIDGSIILDRKLFDDFSKGTPENVTFALIKALPFLEKVNAHLNNQNINYSIGLINYDKCYTLDKKLIEEEKEYLVFLHKHPKFSYQKEFRIQINREIDIYSHEPHKEILGSINDISTVYSFQDINIMNSNYILNLS